MSSIDTESSNSPISPRNEDDEIEFPDSEPSDAEDTPEKPKPKPKPTQCNGSLVDVDDPPVEQPFDCLAFARFRKFENRFLKEERRIMLKEGKPVPDSSYYTDGVILHDLLVQTYGPLDKDTVEYEHILREFRTSKIEQLEEWEKQEKKPGYLAKPNRIPKLQTKFWKTFTKEQIDSFNLNPFTNQTKADWFNLPRPTFSIEKEIGYIPPGEEEILNLALFDPRFDLDVQYGWSDNPVLHSIPPLARQSLEDHLDNYPLGIAPSVFLESGVEGVKRLEVPLEYRFWSSLIRNPTDFVNNVDDIGWIQEANGIRGKILFPSYLEGSVLEFNKMLKRSWHLIKILLSLNGGYAVPENLLEAHLKHFGEPFPVNPENWALSGLGEMIRICNGKWPDKKVLLVPIIRSELDSILNRTSKRAELFLLRTNLGRPHPCRKKSKKGQGQNGEEGKKKVKALPPPPPPPKSKPAPKKKTLGRIFSLLEDDPSDPDF